MITETIDELIRKNGIELTEKPKEYIEVELVDGEKITIEKDKYEKLVKDHKKYGEILY